MAISSRSQETFIQETVEKLLVHNSVSQQQCPRLLPYDCYNFLEKAVDDLKADTKKNIADLADLKGWRSLIAPFFVAIVVALLTGLINWVI